MVDQATDFPFWSQTNLFIQQSTLGPLTAKKLISFLGSISFSILGSMSFSYLGSMSFLSWHYVLLGTMSFFLALCPLFLAQCPLFLALVSFSFLALSPPWFLGSMSWSYGLARPSWMPRMIWPFYLFFAQCRSIFAQCRLFLVHCHWPWTALHIGSMSPFLCPVSFDP